MPSLDWNTAGACFSNVSEALPLMEIGLYLLITLRWNPDPGADRSVLRQALLTQGLSLGQGSSSPPQGSWMDAPAGLAGSWHGQCGTAPARTTSSPSAAQGGPVVAEGAALAPAQEESGSACHRHRELERSCCKEQDFSCRTHEISAALRQEQVSPPSNCPWLP